MIVGNKLDLQKSPSTINRSTHLKDRAESVLTKYMVRIDRWDDDQNVDSCLECSAKTRQNIRDVFYVAQRTISFPSLPLFDKMTQTLTSSYSRILRHVFRFFDHDCDGLWSTSELNAFQVSLLFIVNHNRNSHTLPNSLLKRSILYWISWRNQILLPLFKHSLLLRIKKVSLKKDSLSLWDYSFIEIVLNQTGWCWDLWGTSYMNWSNRYNDDLTWKVQPGDLNVVSRGKIPEWSEEGLKYLNQVSNSDDRLLLACIIVWWRSWWCTINRRSPYDLRSSPWWYSSLGVLFITLVFFILCHH